MRSMSQYFRRSDPHILCLFVKNMSKCINNPLLEESRYGSTLEGQTIGILAGLHRLHRRRTFGNAGCLRLAIVLKPSVII